MPNRQLGNQCGIGATDRLSLRVSVATPVRVLLENPTDGEWMLALERKALLRGAEIGDTIQVKAQPFGGAVRIHDSAALHKFIGDFHFDSEESRAEQDFRLFVQPKSWLVVKEFCLHHFEKANNTVFESNPCRELIEELQDALEIHVKLDQFTYRAVGTIIENDPAPTENARSSGYPTARVYRIFEARILDPSLALAMLANSQSFSDAGLADLARESLRNGSPGRSNAVLTIPLKEITDHYVATAPEARNHPTDFQDHRLDETVAAVLENVPVPKYQQL